MSAPWESLVPLGVALTIWGIAGLVFGGVIIRRARRQTEYVPVWDDWFWYVAAPIVAYGTLTAAAASLWLLPAPGLAPFVVAGTALVLLLLGIHNAWDTVVHIALTWTPDDGA